MSICDPGEAPSPKLSSILKRGALVNPVRFDPTLTTATLIVVYPKSCTASFGALRSMATSDSRFWSAAEIETTCAPDGHNVYSDPERPPAGLLATPIRRLRGSDFKIRLYVSLLPRTVSSMIDLR